MQQTYWHSLLDIKFLKSIDSLLLKHKKTAKSSQDLNLYSKQASRISVGNYPMLEYITKTCDGHVEVPTIDFYLAPTTFSHFLDLKIS